MLITKNVVTREEVIAAVRELAGKLGRSPRYPEVIRQVNVTRRQIQRMFGGWAGVLEESECERVRLGGGELTMHELWHDWVAVVRKGGRMPTIRQYEKFSRYSVRPLKDRFAAWERIPATLLEYGNAKGLWAGWEDVRELIGRKVDVCTVGERYTGSPTSPRSHDILPRQANSGLFGGPDIAVIGKSKPTTESTTPSDENRVWWGPRQRHGESQNQGWVPMPEVVDEDLLYGEPLNLDPMATAPVNEMGVVYLFGTLARELGFVVLKMHRGFPDCEALRRLGNGKWQRVRIEFEFESRNFVWHAHDVTGCELIVCWENNWEECPLEVLELKKIFTADLRG